MRISDVDVKSRRPARRLLPLTAWVALVALPGLSAPASAAPLSPRVYLELAVSPDGRFVASVEGNAPASGSYPVVRELLIRSADGKTETSVPLPCGAHGAVPECWPSSPAWTADGKHLSFALRTPGSHARSIYTVDAHGRGAEKVLAFDGTIRALHYTATGALAMLATAGATKEVGATEAGAPITGDIDAASPEQRLAVLESGQHQLHWVSRPDLFVYEYDALPDGSGFVATAAPGDGDSMWWVAKLYAFPMKGDERVVYAPQNAQEQLANPRVSPDGKQVAMIVGLMSDFGSTGGDIFSVPLAGGAAQNLTPDLRASVTSIHWRHDGHLLAKTLVGDTTQQIDISTPGARPYWEGQTSLHDFSEAGGSSPLEASIQESFTQAPEIYVGEGRDWHALTQRNAGLTNQFSVQSLTWQNEGFKVQGWLLLPAGKTGAASKLPMIVDVHGGPAAAAVPRFVGATTLVHALLDHGYALFLPNPRGSFGQGETFTKANVKDFGGGDLRDILAGVDAAIKDHGIDPERLGLTGHSYGGYMTMWTVTQTNRFKAAVAGAGIVNWQSYYGQNGINEWMIPYFGASIYADPTVYAKSSPINFITHVKTPTFSYVGANDIECPAPQTQEFGRALRILGVPAMTVLYPGEGHGFRNPATSADIERRTLAWFAKYLGG